MPLSDLLTEKVTRGAAIITVKRWLPDVQPMSDMVRTFALRLLRRLQKRPRKDTEKADREGTGDGSEDGEMPQEEVVQTEYLPEEVELPANKSQVLQHVELIFALSVKSTEFLDEYVLFDISKSDRVLTKEFHFLSIFDAYAQMDVSVQEAIQDLITALIRSLGPNHGKLLTLMRTFPSGSESLALRVLTIFTENGRPTPAVVSLVKGLMADRNLDPKFLIPIIAEMDKVGISTSSLLKLWYPLN